MYVNVFSINNVNKDKALTALNRLILHYMFKFETWTLQNGLRVIYYPTPKRTKSTVNILYNVGARDENPNLTGFAHLFEHLMFAGSKHVKSYDAIVENAGGTNNAYTTNDITNYYITTPLQNLETALWLESDRMLSLNINENSLNIQKKVVIEEFKQRYHNSAFGMLWHDTRNLLFEDHPYQWPTIGKNFEQIENATLAQVQHFYDCYYNPNNAIICIAADIELNYCKALVNKYFENIENAFPANTNQYPIENKLVKNTNFRNEDLHTQRMYALAWRLPGMLDPSYLHLSCFTNMFSKGYKSPSYKSLVANNGPCTDAALFVSPNKSYSIGMIYGMLTDTCEIESAKTEIYKSIANCVNDKSLSNNDLASIKAKSKMDYQSLKFNSAGIAERLCIEENNGNIQRVNSYINELNTVTLNECYLAAENAFIKNPYASLTYFPK